MDCLCSDANDTACRSATRISSLLRLLVPALSEVISASVNDNGSLYRVSAIKIVDLSYAATYTKDTVLTNQLDMFIRNGALGIALSIGLEVAQITNVTFGV